MFDTRKTGLKIMSLRKAKDMTQMELADLMQVSYQAVSNWERGNSMPDISKLTDLARVLDVSIEELLDSSEQAQTVRRATQEEEKLTIQEIAEVAPILKPSKLKESIEKAPLESITSTDLMMLAPFLSKDKLMELLEACELEEFNELTPFIPFLESEQIQSILVRKGELHEHLEDVIKVAPFLEREFLFDIAKKVINDDDDPGLLAPLAPFLDSNDLMTLIEEAEAENVNDILPLAPFLSSKDLVSVLARMDFHPQNMKQLIKLSPFIKEENLNELLVQITRAGKKVQEKQSPEPPQSKDSLKDYAKSLVEKGDYKTLKSILPLLDEDALD